MRNIYLMPSADPTRLVSSAGSLHFLREGDRIDRQMSCSTYQNVYITSEDSIQEGDPFIHFSSGITGLYRARSVVKESILTQCGDACWTQNCHKIILTTDVSLIENGIGQIDDQALDWIVKGPACDRVEVQRGKMRLNSDGEEIGFPDMSAYKICIPSDEVDQECNNLNYGGGFTEEDIKSVTTKIPSECLIKCYCGHTNFCDCGPAESKFNLYIEESEKKYPEIVHVINDVNEIRKIFVDGAKFGASMLYSEETVLDIIQFVKNLKYMDGTKSQSDFTGPEILNQFKKV